MKLPTFLKLKENHKEKVSSGSPFHPDRDWAMMLSVFGILLLLCTGWGVSLYFKEEEVITSSSLTAGEKTARDLRNIKDFFEKREGFSPVLSEDVADPSL